MRWRGITRRLRDWRASKRLRARKKLAERVWPALWRRAGENPIAFIDMAVEFTARDPNWKHDTEWVRSAEDPGVFAAHKTHRAIDRAYHPLCPLCRADKRTDR